MKSFLNAVRLVFRAIARSKLRAALTVLGILIGVAAVVIVVALGTGTRDLMTLMASASSELIADRVVRRLHGDGRRIALPGFGEPHLGAMERHPLPQAIGLGAPAQALDGGGRLFAVERFDHGRHANPLLRVDGLQEACPGRKERGAHRDGVSEAGALLVGQRQNGVESTSERWPGAEERSQ